VRPAALVVSWPLSTHVAAFVLGLVLGALAVGI
jgi:hypothetical protein